MTVSANSQRRIETRGNESLIQREPLDVMIFRTPAAVLSRASTDDLMALARARAGDPSAFDDFPPVFFSAQISNQRIDSYFTRMAESTLQNFARDAAAGVSLQDSHLTRQLGLGRSLTGAFFPPDDQNVGARVVSDFFTIRGLDDTDAFIARLRTGIASDVSVGFYGGQFICNICGLDMLTEWDCWHYPGMTYDVTTQQPDGPETSQEVVCIADVVDARLAEVSPVYKGATPGAAIIKAERALEAGILKPETARLLETCYRHLGVSLPNRPVQVPGIGDRSLALSIEEESSAMTQSNNNPAGGAPAQTDAERLAALQSSAIADLTSFRGFLSELGLPSEIASPLDAGRALVAEIRRLKPLADDGSTYRTVSIEAAIKSGVRAFGSEGDGAFKVEENRTMLAALPVAEVVRMGEAWETIAKSKLPAGRSTTEGEPPPAESATTATPAIPDRAFGGR